MPDHIHSELSHSKNMYGDPLVKFDFPEILIEPPILETQSFGPIVDVQSISKRRNSHEDVDLVLPRKVPMPEYIPASLAHQDILTVPDSPIHSPKLRELLVQLQQFSTLKPKDTQSFSLEIIPYYQEGTRLQKELSLLLQDQDLTEDEQKIASAYLLDLQGMVQEVTLPLQRENEPLLEKLRLVLSLIDSTLENRVEWTKANSSYMKVNLLFDELLLIRDISKAIVDVGNQLESIHLEEPRKSLKEFLDEHRDYLKSRVLLLSQRSEEIEQAFNEVSFDLSQVDLDALYRAENNITYGPRYPLSRGARVMELPAAPLKFIFSLNEGSHGRWSGSKTAFLEDMQDALGEESVAFSRRVDNLGSFLPEKIRTLMDRYAQNLERKQQEVQESLQQIVQAHQEIVKSLEEFSNFSQPISSENSLDEYLAVMKALPKEDVLRKVELTRERIQDLKSTLSVADFTKLKQNFDLSTFEFYLHGIPQTVEEELQRLVLRLNLQEGKLAIKRKLEGKKQVRSDFAHKDARIIHDLLASHINFFWSSEKIQSVDESVKRIRQFLKRKK
jgi:hypothetical protein